MFCHTWRMREPALSPDQQHSAISLYEGGMSAPMLAQYFAVSIDAIYYTLRHNNVPRRSPSQNSQIRFAAKPLSYELKEDLAEEDLRLKVAGVMLYWAEGYKAGERQVDFCNSDPDMMQLFRKFLSDICRVDETRLRAFIYCYEGQDIEALTSFWSERISIPREQFTKPYIKKQATPGPQGPRMIHGLVHIRYCDKKLLQQILSWIDEYRVECVGTQAVNEGTL